MTNKLNWLISAVIAAVVAFGVVSLFGSPAKRAGGTTINNLATWAPSFGVSNSNGVEADIGFWDAAGAASNFLGSLAFSSNVTTAGIGFQGSAGTCGSATSTMFSIVNPTSATSTVEIDMMTLTGQATSTTFSIGTTTKSSGLALTDISPTLVNAALVATGTQATLISGFTTNLGNGQISSGTGSVDKIVVGPNERVAGYATSTYGGVGALNYTPAVSCTYKLLWNF